MYSKSTGVNLKCLDTDASHTIEATKGLACEVISGGINLQCEVEGLINKNATSFNFKSGTKVTLVIYLIIQFG
jgi:hypothetical protein